MKLTVKTQPPNFKNILSPMRQSRTYQNIVGAVDRKRESLMRKFLFKRNASAVPVHSNDPLKLKFNVVVKLKNTETQNSKIGDQDE